MPSIKILFQMHLLMFFAAHHLKIFKSIILRIAVYVMNNRIKWKLFPKVGFHDMPVKIFSHTVYIKLFISFAGGAIGAFTNVLAMTGTRAVKALTSFTSLPSRLFQAIQAFYNDAGPHGTSINMEYGK